MKNINKYFLLTLISAGVLFSSCKKSFLDINDNPNQPTDVNITPELIFISAAEGVGATAAGARASGAGAKTSLQFAQNWVGYMSSNGDFARDNTETSYDIDFSFGNTLFLTRYGLLFDLHQVETKALAQGNKVLAGASIILAAKEYQELVDLFGNLPYTQAFQPNTYPTPKYDKAEDIYADLQKRLDTGIAYMQTSAPASFPETDIVNKGNQPKWIKFANTLKLRILLRLSQISSAPTAEIAKIVAKGGALGVGENVSENPSRTTDPGYTNDQNKQSPFYANYGYTVTGAKATTGTNPNEYIVDLLASTNDARIERFFTPLSNGSFAGTPYGLPAGALLGGSAVSYFGPGLVGSAAQDQWIIPAYESLFFQAEAVSRGWAVSSSDAKTLLTQAIEQSFVFLGVPGGAATADTYITDNNVLAEYDNAVSTGGPDGGAKYIALQKYIANTGIDALESYSDIRRLDFLHNHSYLPVSSLFYTFLEGNDYISQNEGKVSNTIPVRLLYPQSEYTSNGVNVGQQGNISALTSKIFWQN